jgi:DNA (cytosine-5)-methyltransferase 1
MRVLDTFSCKGGGGKGYRDAGHDVTSVDIVDYSAYFEPGTFHQADAVDFIYQHGHEFDFIHASPLCLPYTRGNAPRRVNGVDPNWPTQIEATRAACESSGKPYVIENVEGARRFLRSPVLLCGRMFGLEAVDTHPDAVGMKLILDRHRLFEFGNMPRPAQPFHPKHQRTSGIGLRPSMWDETKELLSDLAMKQEARCLTGRPHVAGVYGGARRDPWEAKYIRRGGYVPRDVRVLQDLLGCHHIDTEAELFEAIPPAYTTWIVERVDSILSSL